MDFFLYPVMNREPGLFYGQCNSDAERKKWSERRGPESQNPCGHPQSPFPVKEKIEQISAPDWAVHHDNDQNKQQQSFPVVQLMPCLDAPVFKPKPYMLHTVPSVFESHLLLQIPMEDLHDR